MAGDRLVSALEQSFGAKEDRPWTHIGLCVWHMHITAIGVSRLAISG